MSNRLVFAFCLFLGSAATLAAGEDIMPMAPGAGWRTDSAVSGDAAPRLRKNAVTITLPSLAARARPDDMILEARDIGFTDIPGLFQPEPPAPARIVSDPRRHHVPEEMRFPMEPPLGASPDAAIASDKIFGAMLDDLVSFGDAPAPGGVPASAFPLPVPEGMNGRQPLRSAAPVSVPLPSEILRNDPAAFQSVSTPIFPFAADTVAAVPEQASAVSPGEFGATSGSGGMRARRLPDGKPEPHGFTPMLNLRNAVTHTW